MAHHIPVSESGPVCLANPGMFRKLVSPHIYPLLESTLFLTKEIEEGAPLSRALIGTIHQESMKVEELLDSFGAGSNKKWSQFRQAAAQTKAFTNIYYKLLHLQSATPSYHLLPVEGNFQEDLEAVISKTETIVYKNACKIQVLRKKFALPESKGEICFYNKEFNPFGVLPADKPVKHVKDPGKTVTYLASSFLTLNQSLGILDKCAHARENDYGDFIPAVISEEKLRLLENKCHNLQSLFDTNIRESDIIKQDNNLPSLRGHISLIYHLMEISVECCHYYERHQAVDANNEKGGERAPLLSNTDLLNLIFRFLLPYTSRYIKSLQEMCRQILKMYAEEGEITVPIPNYRGFHVRPSTLVSKIILYYGSDVHMYMGEAEYNAAVPLELFRVNEEINAEKRKRIAALIDELSLVQDMQFSKLSPDELKYNLRQIIFHLLESGKLVLYESTFSFDELAPVEAESLVEFARRCVAHYMALGKIDIETDVTVTFKGDKRVLEDLKTLAENGYGEDRFGNNIVLPASLAYLRRSLG